jgi:peroxiredoxin
LRRRYDEIKRHGSEIVAIGTGDIRYARAFVDDENLPFPVLVDDDAEAARAASVPRVRFLKLFDPASFPGTVQAWPQGYRLYWPGKRTNQLGATFVIGPGSQLHFQHVDAHPADHAPLDEVIAAIPAPAPGRSQ